MKERHLQMLFEMFMHDNENVMYEGLVVNNKNRTISLTDEHNKGIDLSLENSPIEYKLNGIDVISIFKRTPLKAYEKDVDGNPFIYALKGERNWKFDMSETDVIKYMKRFLQVCSKIKNRYDTIITVPSQSWINKRFMDVIAEQVKAKYKITDYFDKCDIDVAYNSIDEEEIRKYAKMINPRNPEAEIISIWNKLERCFGRMEKEHKKFFTAKLVDKDLLRFIKNPISTKTSNVGECAEYFNDKDVLILDDILASGTTLSFCAQNILDTYSPKSVTAITLLSKKFN